MIKKIDDKSIKQIKRRAKETISFNVILNIGLLELELKEQVMSSDELCKNEAFMKINENESRFHKDLLKVAINELIVNFNQATNGVQKITMVLTNFSV